MVRMGGELDRESVDILAELIRTGRSRTAANFLKSLENVGENSGER